jgi:hypothetical protein
MPAPGLLASDRAPSYDAIMPKMMDVLTRVSRVLVDQPGQLGLTLEVLELAEICRQATGDVSVRVTEDELTALAGQRLGDGRIRDDTLERALLELSLWRKLK